YAMRDKNPEHGKQKFKLLIEHGASSGLRGKEELAKFIEKTPVTKNNKVTIEAIKNWTKHSAWIALENYARKLCSMPKGSDAAKKGDKIFALLESVANKNSDLERLKILVAALQDKDLDFDQHRSGGPHIEEPKTMQLIRNLIKEIQPPRCGLESKR